MTSEQAYTKFLIKSDDNFENSKIACDRGRFVLLYNEGQNKMIEIILDKKKDDEIRYIQQILVSDKKIKKSKTLEQIDIFTIPKNYFDFASAYTKASTEDCEEQIIDTFEIKEDNKNIILSDEFNKPSFLAREAPLNISSNEIRVYKDGFTHNEIYLSYYRYPEQIKLVDEDNPESEFDSNNNPEFDDKFVDRILSMVSSEFAKNSSDPKYQIDQQRAIQKI